MNNALDVWMDGERVGSLRQEPRNTISSCVTTPGLPVLLYAPFTLPAIEPICKAFARATH